MIPKSQWLKTSQAYLLLMLHAQMAQLQHCVSSFSGTKGAAPIWDTARPTVVHMGALKASDWKRHLSLPLTYHSDSHVPSLTPATRGCGTCNSSVGRGAQKGPPGTGSGSIAQISQGACTVTSMQAWQPVVFGKEGCQSTFSSVHSMCSVFAVCQGVDPAGGRQAGSSEGLRAAPSNIGAQGGPSGRRQVFEVSSR